MPDLVAGLPAGAGAAAAIILAVGAAPRGRRPDRRLQGRRVALAAGVALAGLGAGALVLAESQLPVMALVAGTAPALAARAAFARRARRRRQAREDAVLESIRMLRRLLETGSVGVQQAVAAVAEKGPSLLRTEFRAVGAAALSGRHVEAWSEARRRVDDAAFDMLVAAIAVQRPAGGRLGPVFEDLEEAAAARHDVVREAEALQVQARGAAAMIMSLPLCFIAFLTLVGSPYLAVYRTGAGELFLAAALAAMAGGYGWMLAWLRLPPPARLRMRDG